MFVKRTLAFNVFARIVSSTTSHASNNNRNREREMISIFALRDPKALKDHTRKLNQSKYSTSSEHINSEESNFTSTLMQTSQKIWWLPNPNKWNQTRKSRSTWQFKSCSDTEDNNAEDAVAMTPCG